MRTLENWELTVGTMIVPLQQVSREYTGNYVTEVSSMHELFHSERWCYSSGNKGYTHAIVGERFGVRVSNRFETLESR